jgi:ribosomal protein S18 acetylase RimI-like enzyme
VTDAPLLAFSHYDAPLAERVIETTILPLHEATRPDLIGDPFYSAERFAERIRGYMRAAGFEMVVAEVEGAPRGLALGYTLPEGARWWRGLTTPVDPEMIAETGDRTFGLCELMVHPDWQRRGIAQALHDELLGQRPERRATVLVREDNTQAQRAYAKWGWRKVGKLQPFSDSPHYDALVLDLAQTGSLLAPRPSAPGL